MAGEPPDPHLAEWMSKVDTKLDTIAEACKKLLVSSEGQATCGAQRRFPFMLRGQSGGTVDLDVGPRRAISAISIGSASRSRRQSCNSSQEKEWRQELLERSRNIMAGSLPNSRTPSWASTPRKQSTSRSLVLDRTSSFGSTGTSVAHRPSLAADRPSPTTDRLSGLSVSDRPSGHSVGDIPSVAEEDEKQEQSDTPAADRYSLSSQDHDAQAPCTHTRSVGFRRSETQGCTETPRATMRSLTELSELTEKVKGFSKEAAHTRSLTDSADDRLSERLQHRLTSWKHDSKVIRAGAMSRFVMSQKFDCAILVIILFNALLIGVQVHHSAVSNKDETWLFELLELICTGIFIAELALRMAVMGRTFLTSLEERWWNLFDAALVGLSIIDVVLSKARSDGLPDSSLSGLCRIVRIMRILRIIRTVRFLGQVRILMKMIFMNSLQSLFWIMLILAGIIYSFSIVLTQAATDYRKRGQSPGDLGLVEGRFGSLFESMYTLFQCITGGVSWGEVSVLMRGPGWVMEAIVILYVFFTVFAVNNIVNGVFVDGAIELAKRDRASVVSKQKADDAAHETSIVQLLRAIDEDEDGFITFDEFCEALEKPNILNYISALNVEISDARRFFALLDESNDGVVGVAQFVTGMMKLRGEAKNADIHMMMYENHMLTRMVTGLVDLIGESMAMTQQPMPTSEDQDDKEPDEQPRCEAEISQLFAV